MYTITITKTETTEKKKRGDWTVVGNKPVPDDERSEYPKNHDGMQPVYGYAPDRVVTETEQREVYKQQIAELELADVILAINKIEP